MRRFWVDVLKRMNQCDMVRAKFLLQSRKIQPFLAVFLLTSPVQLPTEIGNLAIGFGLGLITPTTAANLSSVCL